MPTPTTTLPAQVSPPAFALSSLAPHEITGAEVLALPFTVVDDEPVLGSAADAAAEALGLDLAGVLTSRRAKGKGGEIVALPIGGGGPRLVLLVGLGEGTTTDYRRAGAAVARATFDHESVATAVPGGDDEALTAYVVGMMLGSFVFHWRSRGPEREPVRRVVLAGLSTDDHAAALERGLALGGAGWRSRMLATVPSNLKSPQWLAEQAEQIAAEHGLEVDVWDEVKLAKQGFGGILGVGQGSATPPRLIRLDYTPAGARRRVPRVVLVGKGITFDSGGLSIKPAEGMATMKRDMTGGAVVMAVMGALGALGCPLRVTGLVSAAENAVGGSSLRPGDVVTHYGGRTSEVLNTDAEGRLVLADAMAYALDKLDPAVLVDVATLTGTMKVALGQWTGGFFANRDALAEALSAAGAAAGEPLWRMPLEPDYEESLTSQVADANNAPGGPGAITAALFLQHFAGDVPWAHLDIASTGDAPSDSFEWTKGPTGFGPRLLLTWLTGPDPLAGIA
ncbi:MAG TPA: leucyl aminopeptidase family protein [Nocardioides sp.]|uniref:leucyl aminopeptidase family protein n=1 Tax=Nocardioides sp. TaxID=35761 RepID=UPI002F3E4535